MTKAYSETLYWLMDPSWHVLDEETRTIKMTDLAPERARKSYEAWRRKMTCLDREAKERKKD